MSLLDDFSGKLKESNTLFRVVSINKIKLLKDEIEYNQQKHKKESDYNHYAIV